MARKPQDNPALDMTPMIDVVFELIIFFVVTIKQEDIYSRLNANRPAPATNSSSDSDEVTVEIRIQRDPSRPPERNAGIVVYNGRSVKLNELDDYLKDIARTSKKTPIIVKCTADSPHKALVDVLDVCYKNELMSVSVFSF